MDNKLTVIEIAKAYNVTRSGVYFWLENGLKYEVEKVVGIRPRKVISTKDVDEFLNIGIRKDK